LVCREPRFCGTLMGSSARFGVAPVAVRPASRFPRLDSVPGAGSTRYPAPAGRNNASSTRCQRARVKTGRSTVQRVFRLPSWSAGHAIRAGPKARRIMSASGPFDTRAPSGALRHVPPDSWCGRALCYVCDPDPAQTRLGSVPMGAQQSALLPVERNVTFHTSPWIQRGVPENGRRATDPGLRISFPSLSREPASECRARDQPQQTLICPHPLGPSRAKNRRGRPARLMRSRSRSACPSRSKRWLTSTKNISVDPRTGIRLRLPANHATHHYPLPG